MRKSRPAVRLLDVARAAGVHPDTASHALSNPKGSRISQATLERIRSAAEALGYHPNGPARALATGRTGIIAIRTFDHLSPFSARLAHALQKKADEAGYLVLALEDGLETPTLASLVDGVVDLCCSDPEGMKSIHGSYISLSTAAPQGVDFVQLDVTEAAQEVMSVLLAGSRKTVLYLGMVAEPGHEDPRETAYCEGMAQAGLTPQILGLKEDSCGCAHEALLEWLRPGRTPDALFCRNDLIAIGCIRALSDWGIRCPKDVLVIGCDGIEQGEYHIPTLTTISLPIAEAACSAWSLFARRLEDPELPPQSAIHKGRLIRRQSA